MSVRPHASHKAAGRQYRHQAPNAPAHPSSDRRSGLVVLCHRHTLHSAGSRNCRPGNLHCKERLFSDHVSSAADRPVRAEIQHSLCRRAVAARLMRGGSAGVPGCGQARPKPFPQVQGSAKALLVRPCRTDPHARTSPATSAQSARTTKTRGLCQGINPRHPCNACADAQDQDWQDVSSPVASSRSKGF